MRPGDNTLVVRDTAGCCEDPPDPRLRPPVARSTSACWCGRWRRHVSGAVPRRRLVDAARPPALAAQRFHSRVRLVGSSVSASERVTFEVAKDFTVRFRVGTISASSAASQRFRVLLTRQRRRGVAAQSQLNLWLRRHGDGAHGGRKRHGAAQRCAASRRRRSWRGVEALMQYPAGHAGGAVIERFTTGLTSAKVDLQRSSIAGAAACRRCWAAEAAPAQAPHQRFRLQPGDGGAARRRPAVAAGARLLERMKNRSSAGCWPIRARLLGAGPPPPSRSTPAFRACTPRASGDVSARDRRSSALVRICSSADARPGRRSSTVVLICLSVAMIIVTVFVVPKFATFYADSTPSRR